MTIDFKQPIRAFDGSLIKEKGENPLLKTVMLNLLRNVGPLLGELPDEQFFLACGLGPKLAQDVTSYTEPEVALLKRLVVGGAKAGIGLDVLAHLLMVMGGSDG